MTANGLLFVKRKNNAGTGLPIIDDGYLNYIYRFEYVMRSPGIGASYLSRMRRLQNLH
jgi:hypothetical protein